MRGDGGASKLLERVRRRVGEELPCLRAAVRNITGMSSSI